jgi:transcriptional regulator with XRE-family HTH domain
MGDQIRAARENLQLSTQAAAEAAEISSGYLFKLESGYVGTPSPRVLHRLSGVLGINYWHLMELAGYMVPADDTTPAVAAPAAPAPADPVPADPADVLQHIAEILGEIRDEMRGMRKRMGAQPKDAPPADT